LVFAVYTSTLLTTDASLSVAVAVKLNAARLTASTRNSGAIFGIERFVLNYSSLVQKDRISLHFFFEAFYSCGTIPWPFQRHRTREFWCEDARKLEGRGRTIIFKEVIYGKWLLSLPLQSLLSNLSQD